MSVDTLAHFKQKQDIFNNSKFATKASIPTVDDELSDASTNPVQNKVIKVALDSKADTAHTHSYAGSESVGGSAISAVKLDTSGGSAMQPIYFEDGIPVATAYTLEASVPSDAKFTDTTYSVMEPATSDGAGSTGLVPAPEAGKNTSFLRGDGTWVIPTDTTYNDFKGATNSEAGSSGLVPAPSSGSTDLFLKSDGTWGTPNNSDVNVWKSAKAPGEFYKSDEAPDSDVVGKYDGYLYATRVYNAVWNDYAELFEAAEKIEVGHVAYAKEDGVVVAKGKPSCAVGVVSDRWGHLLGGNGDHNSEDYAAISLAGRVPVKVKGNVSVGDLIAASDDGIAKKAEISDFGCIIGKCVGVDPDGRDDFVLMLVGVM